ncbi:hypothetical protein MBLNU230_g7993t1 [Neophaeotheca triangularis]
MSAWRRRVIDEYNSDRSNSCGPTSSKRKPPPPSSPETHPPLNAFEEVVWIAVGGESGASEAKTIPVHKGVLTFYPGYFKGALNGGFAEAQSDTITLKTESASSFAHLVRWMYTRQLPNRGTMQEGDSLIQLYILADRRMVPLLMNAVIDQLRNLVAETGTFPTHRLKDIYKNTIEGSPLRKFTIDIIGRTSYAKDILSDDQLSWWPLEAIVDLTRSVWTATPCARLTTEDQIKGMDTCHFHTHEEGFFCSKM